NFLGALDLKNFRHQMAALGRSLPMDFVGGISWNVFAQLFEFAALSDLALRMQAKGAAIEKQSGEMFSLGEQVGVHPDFQPSLCRSEHRPKAKTRSPFEISPVQLVTPAF